MVGGGEYWPVKKYADRGATAVVPGVALAVHGCVAEWVPRKTESWWGLASQSMFRNYVIEIGKRGKKLKPTKIV